MKLTIKKVSNTRLSVETSTFELEVDTLVQAFRVWWITVDWTEYFSEFGEEPDALLYLDQIIDEGSIEDNGMCIPYDDGVYLVINEG